jgi:hypothetical protein
MRTRLVLSAVAALAAASFVFVHAARAGDPPAGGMPPMQKKITHPMLTGAVGEWNVTWTATEQGQTQTGTATSKVALQAGDTLMVEDYSAADMMPGGFHGHGVTKVSPDGKTVTTWWFDSMGSEPIKLTGPLTDTTATIEGETPMGAMKIVHTKVDGGCDFEGTLNGQPWLKQQYRKK